MTTYKDDRDKKLQESESLYCDVVEGTNDLITSVDSEGRIVYINHKSRDIFGLSPSECEGQYAFDFIHPEDQDRTRKWFHACIAERLKQSSMENRQVNRKDGSVHSMLWTSTFYYDQHGNVTGVNGIARDITERKLTEKLLQESENKFRSFFNQASDSIFLLSINEKDLIIEDVNDAAIAAHGYGRGELIGKGITFLDDKESASHVPERIKTLIDRKSMIVEVDHRRKDGSVFPVEVNAKLIQIGDKPYILAIDRDITERKMAELAMAEQLRLEALGSSIGDALITGNSLQDMMQRCAEEFVRHLKIPFARIWTMNEHNNVLILQASAGMYTHLDGKHSRIPLGSMKIGQIASTGKPHLTNQVIGDPQISDQEWVREKGMVAFAGYPLIIDKRVIGVMAIFSKERLTENILKLLGSVAVRISLGVDRMRSEKELAESEERYKKLFQSSHAVMLLIDPDTASVVDANPAALEFYGYSYENFINIKMKDVNTLSPEEVATEIARAKQQGRNYFVFPHRLASGRVRTVEVYSGPVPVKGKQLLFSIVHDISDRIQAEQERERLTAEMEQVIFATSHDMRSPMLNIHGYSHIMSESVEKCRSLIPQSGMSEVIQAKMQGIFDEHIAEPVRYIKNSIRQMDSILSGLLALSRSGRVQLSIENLDMNRLLSNMIGYLQIKIKEEGIELHLSTLPPCRGDEVQMGQVFTNLIENAIKYLDPERHGIIHITGKQKGAESVYCVEDNGIGIPAADINKIFTIFYQVDHSNRGEGLGLTIVKKTVERHGGRIWAESEPGKGSKFYVALPATGNG